jgi:hypothetical protein
MRLLEKLKEYENQFMFIRWATGGEYGKLLYVGKDFIEFEIVDLDNMEFSETMFIQGNLILEASIGGCDIARIIAEFSSKISE